MSRFSFYQLNLKFQLLKLLQKLDIRAKATKFFSNFFCQWKKQPWFGVNVCVMFVAENRKAMRVPERAIGAVATSLHRYFLLQSHLLFPFGFQIHNAINQFSTIQLHLNRYFQYQCKFLLAMWVYQLVRFEMIDIFRCFWTLYDLQKYYRTIIAYYFQ